MAEAHEVKRIRPQLYLITPPDLDLEKFAGQLRQALDGGAVACVQLRLKDTSDDAIIAAAQALMPLCHAKDVAFIVNDRPDLARAAGADGVHVGQEDTTYAEARAIVGDDHIVGVTCHNSRHLAMVAAEAGADYVAFGAFYPTTTKDPKTEADIELLRWWGELMEVPCVAIGGITVDNCRPLLEAGADFLAVSAGVWDYAEGPGEAVRRFNAIIDEHEKARAE